MYTVTAKEIFLAGTQSDARCKTRSLLILAPGYDIIKIGTLEQLETLQGMRLSILNISQGTQQV